MWGSCQAPGRQTVSATFTVPYISGRNGESVALWDGFGDGPGIEQTGITLTRDNGHTVATVWWELWPGAPVQEGTLQTHNRVTETVTNDGGGWYTMSVFDWSNGHGWSHTGHTGRSTPSPAEFTAEGYGPPLPSMAGFWVDYNFTPDHTISQLPWWYWQSCGAGEAYFVG
jgi:hypothetical protein